MRVLAFVVLIPVGAVSLAQETPFVYLFTTLAGQAGVAGSADGSGSTARFRFPSSIAVDRAGTVFVADAGNGTIRAIFRSGLVTTVAGKAGEFGSRDSPMGGAARFGRTVADWRAARTSSHADTRFYSGPDGRMGLAIGPNGELLIADTLNGTIRRMTTEAPFPVTTIAGQAGDYDHVDGDGVAARFKSPTGICVATEGLLYVTDAGELTVSTISVAGTVATVAGSLRFTTVGPLLPPAQPIRETVDGTGTAARFASVGGIVADASGAIYIVDWTSIRKMTPEFAVSTLAGSIDRAGWVDATSSDARFQLPEGIALLPDAGLIVADLGNHRIRRVAFDGTVSTLAGGAAGSADGIGPEARFTMPLAVAVDGDRNIYVADTNNHTIRKGVRLAAPAISAPPQTQTIEVGQPLTLTVAATSATTPTYQWQKDGQPISGATSATLVIGAVKATDAGQYSVIVRNAGGATASATAVVTVDTSRIVNLSIRTNLGLATPLLTVGFVVSGSGKPLLLRGAGPVLGQFGLASALGDPRLTLFAGSAARASNDDWGGAPNAAEIAAVAGQIGAFPFPTGSADAAILTTLESGGYSAQIAGSAGSSGLVLVELYDAAPAVAARLVNVSARAQVGTGDNILVAGFVLSGNTSRTLLIRGVGPTLAAFGLSGELRDPKVAIFASGNPIAIAQNDDWGSGPASLAATFTKLGAFSLVSPDSKDAAVLVTLEPGSYSAQVSGVDGAVGEALVEIYELPLGFTAGR